MSGYEPVFETTTRGLLIEPLDTMFFRDGRPFGAASSGTSRFPMPQTLMGMIKRHVRKSIGLPASQIHGLRGQNGHEHEWFSRLAVRGPWIAEVDRHGKVLDLFVPVPVNLMKAKNDEDWKTLTLLSPLENGFDLPGWDGSQAGRPLLGEEPKSKDQLKPVTGFLGQAGLEKLLRGDEPTKQDIVKQSDLFGYEDRTGIGLDPARQTVKEGLIYTARHLRLLESRKDGSPGSRLVLYAEIGIEGDEDRWASKIDESFPGGDLVMPFGGEGRRVHVRLAPERHTWPEAPPPPEPDEGGFTSILISPTVFSRRAESNAPEWEPPDLGKRVAAAIGKPLPVSGWTMQSSGSRGGAQGTPKPARWALDAGTVFFWQNGKNAPEDRALPPRFQLAMCPSDRAAGWGTALRGVWRWRKGSE